MYNILTLISIEENCVAKRKYRYVLVKVELYHFNMIW